MIGDSLQHRGHFGHRHNETKVARGGLAQREDVDTLTINFYFQLIDIIVVLKHFAGRRGIAPCQRVQRAHQRRFRLAAQAQDGSA